ncbi:MAG: sel1 repeat family protein, partial [Nitrospinae bacterium]|nr:sel1 repeat family protein [Nitrospinota bacterium]
METNVDDLLAFIMGYWAYAFSLAVAFYSAVSWFGKQHLTQNAKDNLTLWLWGEYESSWSQHFCNIFDAVFGDKHLSWRCFIRSAIASVLAVFFLYILLGEVLGLMDQSHRAGDDLSIGKALLFGTAINIIPDYLSLFETRWLLKRFDQVKSFIGQLGVLVADAVVTGSIIWFAINAFRWSMGEPSLAAIEILALFSVFSLFFYSTFLTSVWAWVFCLSTWFMRLFSRTSLNKVLDVETKPEAQVALVGAVLIFAVAIVLTPFLKKDEQHPVRAIDDLLCHFFPADICGHLGRLSKDDKRALDYLSQACEDGDSKLCTDIALKYFEEDETKVAALWLKACQSGHPR